MKLSEVLTALEKMTTIRFRLPDYSLVPAHFHITEVGKISRHFIDCGGTERTEEKVNFQLWFSDDVDHSLKPEKLAHIIKLSQEKLGLDDAEVEVEYQTDTIGKYNLEVKNNEFALIPTNTACLAEDACGITPKVDFMTVHKATSCDTKGGCC